MDNLQTIIINSLRYCKGGRTVSNSEAMPQIWQDLANEFNKPPNQEVVIAQVDCDAQRDLCYGMHYQFFAKVTSYMPDFISLYRTIGYHMFLILYVGPIQCSTWPTSALYGCTASGGEWVHLDQSLRESDYYICEEMCIGQGQPGCCFLSNSLGCAWKVGANVSQDDSDQAIAITCGPSGN